MTFKSLLANLNLLTTEQLNCEAVVCLTGTTGSYLVRIASLQTGNENDFDADDVLNDPWEEDDFEPNQPYLHGKNRPR
jgi:hypothetical protein